VYCCTIQRRRALLSKHGLSQNVLCLNSSSQSARISCSGGGGVDGCHGHCCPASVGCAGIPPEGAMTLQEACAAWAQNDGVAATCADVKLADASAGSFTAVKVGCANGAERERNVHAAATADDVATALHQHIMSEISHIVKVLSFHRAHSIKTLTETLRLTHRVAREHSSVHCIRAASRLEVMQPSRGWRFSNTLRKSLAVLPTTSSLHFNTTSFCNAFTQAQHFLREVQS
jgi:hypothetical protein